MIQKKLRAFLHPYGAEKIYPNNGFEMWQVKDMQIGIDYVMHEFMIFKRVNGVFIPIEDIGSYESDCDLIVKLKKYLG